MKNKFELDNRVKKLTEEGGINREYAVNNEQTRIENKIINKNPDTQIRECVIRQM